MSTITLPSQLHPSTLAKRILPGVTIGALIVAAIMIAVFSAILSLNEGILGR